MRDAVNALLAKEELNITLIMKKFVLLFNISMHVHLWQWSALSSALFFYCGNLVLINFLIDIHGSVFTFKIFLIFILNFTSAFIIKNAFVEDYKSLRLYYFSQDKYTLINFLLAKVSVFTVYIFIIQIIFYPLIIILFTPLYQNNFVHTMIWFLLSAFYLSIHYLMAESFTIANRANSFMSFVIVIPLLIPWFIFSTAFMLYGQTEALGILFGFILFLTPCLIMAQQWLIKHGLAGAI